MILDFLNGVLHYTIVVRATTKLFGSFCQWVCFDLGGTIDNQPSSGSTSHFPQSELPPANKATATVPKTNSQPASVLRAFGTHTRFVRCLLHDTSSKSTREQITRLRDKLRFASVGDLQSAAVNCLTNRKCGYEDASTKSHSRLSSSLSAWSLMSRALDEKLAALECGFDRPLEELVTQDVLFAELNRDNYRHHMRHLLTLELLAEQRLLMV